jgi:hypothetical protein
MKFQIAAAALFQSTTTWPDEGDTNGARSPESQQDHRNQQQQQQQIRVSRKDHPPTMIGTRTTHPPHKYSARPRRSRAQVVATPSSKNDPIRTTLSSSSSSSRGLWSQHHLQQGDDRDEQQQDHGSDALLLRNTNRRKEETGNLVECDPEDEPDIGILTCGIDYYCLESQNSILGGYCTSSTSAQVNSRALVTSDNFCQRFNGTGTIDNCIVYQNECFPLKQSNPFNAQKACFTETVTGTYAAPGKIGSAEYCYDVSTPFQRTFCHSYMYQDGTSTVTSCSASVEGVLCNSCLFTVCNNTDSPVPYGIVFDCTNTASPSKGSYCQGQFVSPWIVYVDRNSTLAPSPSPSMVPLPVAPETTTGKSGKQHTTGAGIAAGISVPVIAIVAGLLFYFCYHKKKQSGNVSKHSTGQVGEPTESGTAGGTASGTASVANSGLTSGRQIETVATPVSQGGTEYNDYGPTFKGQSMSVVHAPGGEGQVFHHLQQHRVQRDAARIAARQQEMQGDDVPIANAIFALDESIVPRRLDP